MKARAILAVAGLALPTFLAHAQPFQSDGVQLQCWIDLNAFGVPGGNGNSCWGWVSPGGREYALMGLNNKVAFVDITNPTAPVIRATVGHSNSLWADIKTMGNYCYVSNESGGGIQVIDMTNLDSGVATLVRQVTSNGLNTCHTIAVDTVSGFLYLCGSSVLNSSGGVVAFSLADPSNPTYAGQWGGNHYTHECQAVTYTSGPYAGKQIVFACNTNTGLAIIDATNKSNMQTLSITPYFGVNYCHQGWLSEDRQYFYINDELDGPGTGVQDTFTRVINVSNLTSPVSLGGFSSRTPGSTDHNLYVRGNRLYESNYKSGLHIFDITNPTAPVQVGWFDTYPENDSTLYEGTWSNYPYLPSGNIIISDITRGMFVVRERTDFLTFSYPVEPPATLGVFTATPIEVDIANTGSPLNPSSVLLHTRVNAGSYASVPMTNVSGNRYRASLPGAACFDTVSYYVSARNQLGETFYDPSTSPTIARSAVATPPVVTVASYDMEAAAGWTAGAPGDTATTGLWQRGDPEATAAQPGDDHTPGAGVNCWVTGRTAGSGVGANDVDGGFTTLVSPTWDLSAANPDVRIGYWRWYSNNAGSAPNADTFRVDISNDGTAWSSVEVVGPAGAEAGGGWYYHEFRVADVIPLGASLRMRFVADDAGAGSVVEAAVDDLAIFAYDCPAPSCDPDMNQDGIADQDDVAYLINVVGGGDNPAGTDPDFDQNGVADQDDVGALINVVAGGDCP